MRAIVLAVVVILAACSSSNSEPPPRTFGGDRPVTLEIPAPYDASQHYPLVLVLHGYGVNGFVQEAYFGANRLAKSGEAFVLAPDGTVDSTGHQFWNADPACCDLDHRNPDDVGYLGGLVDDVMAAWPVDHAAVMVLGHSNGGYMAYRMACDRSDVVTNIGVLAGAAASDPSTCNPMQPVSVLHMHGSADMTVPYSLADPSVSQWASHDGCGTTRTSGPALDLDSVQPGAETTTTTVDGCPTLTTIELWTIEGADHIPSLDPATFGERMFQYLQAHRRDIR